MCSQQACDHEIYFWTSNKLWQTTYKEDIGFKKLHRFQYTPSEYWWVKFTIDPSGKFLALGHENGDIHLWELDTESFSSKPEILSRAQCASMVRQIAFSPSSNILIAVCGNGSIWRWDRRNKTIKRESECL